MSPPVASGVAQSQPSSTSNQLQSEVKKSSLPPPKPQNVQSKAPRRSSKPIINWFQRKLGGSVKARRVDGAAAQLANGTGRGGVPARSSSNRVASSPLPSPVPNAGRQQSRLDTLSAARRKTISLNGDDASREVSSLSDDDDRSFDESLARESTWSPNSAIEADEDASVRPLPPSSPPSPSPSRSSSSYLSDPRTFKSIAASTKPTTLLSIDLNGNGMAHIAQAPITPVSTTRFPHVRTSSASTTPNPLGSGGSITFSALPPSPQSSSRPDSLREPGSSAAPPGSGIVQAPLHTTHHPRNNPRPSSPPLDNASVLTLASSAYAIPGLRVGSITPTWGSAPPSAIGGGGDSVSHFGGTYGDVESTSQLVIGDDDRLDDRDADASLRALRPRSTRRGSWESEVSRWSARIQVAGTPSVARDRSLWTANSVRTGAFSAENVDASDEADATENDAGGDGSTTGEVSVTVESSAAPDSVDIQAANALSPSIAKSEPTDKTVAEAAPQSTENKEAPALTRHAVAPMERHASADTVAQLSKADQEAAAQENVHDVSTASDTTAGKVEELDDRERHGSGQS